MKKPPEVITDPKEFYESVDWEDWYHEYATATVRGGLPKYASTFAFAKEKGKNRIQRDVILHTIGPVVQGKTPMFSTPQFDWDRARKKGFWLGPETLKVDLATITSKADSLEALRGSGEAHLLPLLTQITGMMEKIEASFMGQIFMPGLSDKQNDARASLYMRLVDQVVKLTIQLQEAYARCLVVNVNDIQGTIMLRDSVASKISREQGTDKRQTESFMGKIIEMTVEKANALKMPLPDPDMRVIAEEVVREA